MKENKADKKESKRKPCKECKWYDWTTEREFHRKVGPKNEKGERALIVEIRAVCRSPKAKARGHLVHATLTKRECKFWEAGEYKPKTKEPTTPNEYFGVSKEIEQLEKESEKKKTAVVKNKLNGETKTLTVKRGKVIVN